MDHWELALYKYCILSLLLLLVLVLKPLSQDLWGKLTKLHISRFLPTRRGKQAGQWKQRPIPVIISGSKMNIDFPSFALSPMVSNSIKSEEHRLHKPTKNQLNIQVHT